MVAWDAGTSGRTEVFAEYKAQRRSRPDLLKQQWPAMEPLVEAFGYRNVRVEGFEADDVIASLASGRCGAEPPVPVMIVTGDRDAFQLIDEQGLVKVMATSRGITETKIYDRQAVIDRYGIPPELIPDFYGLKGDTSDNIPGRSRDRREDRRRADPDASGRSRGCSRTSTTSAGRSANRTCSSTPRTRACPSSWRRSQRDVDVDLDIAAEAAREPDRARLREVFRSYELRDPLRRLEEALGDAELAAPAPAARSTLTARVRAGGVGGHRAAGRRRRELAVRRARARGARGRAVRRGRAVALRASAARRRGARAATATRRRSSSPRCGERARRRARREGARAGAAGPGARHAARAPTCSSPPGAATRSRSCARSAGSRSDLEDPLAGDALLLGALADWQREQIAERGLER